MTLPTVTLDDKYTVESGRIYLTGIQALVRLPLMQKKRDEAAGLDTAGFISGYRGSPLGALDLQLWQAQKYLDQHGVKFKPGVNEELAMTAVWGSQQINLWPSAKHDGVFSMWYGKGPGLDRSSDALRHGNMAGASKHGGVLVLAGDDHGAKSSTVPTQSDHAFMDTMVPVLNPAGVQEILDFGVLGWAMSRYSGAWVGMKTIADTVDSSASVDVAPDRVKIVLPEDFDFPADGVHIRWPDTPLDQEYRHHRYRLYAALAFARANKIDRIVMDSPRARFGIVTTGKSYLDVMQALEELGIDEKLAAEIGIRVYKVGMTWPLEREGARNFAVGLEEVLVVEEKRAVIENQFKEQLYNWDENTRPRVVGKFDEKGNWILPSAGELRTTLIAKVIAERIRHFYSNEELDRRVAYLERLESHLPGAAPIERRPTYCSGCPHNTSTQVPEGSRALGGIGCHYMATWTMPRTETFSQMGGEGVAWIGQSPFSKDKHVFQNLGDGTYYHSGTLAIRAAIAAGVNITYKILYNDAIAMTGGQPVEGTLTVPQIARELHDEGASKIVVVSDEPEKYEANVGLPEGTKVYHRRELDAVQRQMREIEGVSILIYDQTCATEKRRRRKRGLMEQAPSRVFINDLVCEGCGDCNVKSNCVSVLPLETEYGRKRQIDQSSCNQDYSCLEGFCPSFVSVVGGKVRKHHGFKAENTPFETLPEPEIPEIGAKPYGILVTGVGGTGVVTIGALLGMAGHLEGKGVGVLDMTGLAQKGGAVFTHLRFANDPSDIHSIRHSTGSADLMLGCDMVVSGRPDALQTLDPDRSKAIINDYEMMTSDFRLNPDLVFPGKALHDEIRGVVGESNVDFVNAHDVATTLLGDSIATNLFLVGYAWQKGLIPLTEEAINRAIEINGVAVKANKEAFLWGRRTAHNPSAVQKIVERTRPRFDNEQPSQSLDEIIERRVKYLTDYQNKAYGERYRALVEKVRAAENAQAKGKTDLTEAVARYYFKLMAYKDEYEVARLYTDGTFMKKLRRQFEGGYKLQFHMAPPLLAKRDPSTGEMRKMTFGPWMMSAFRLLAKLKALRGTPFDVFGYTEERKTERRLIGEYEATVEELIAKLSADNHALAAEIARIPEEIRGYGHVKEENLKRAKLKEQRLLKNFRSPAPQASAAE